MAGGMGMGNMGSPMAVMGNMGGGMGNMGIDYGHQNPAMGMAGGMAGMGSPGMMPPGRRMTRGMAEEYGMH